MCTVLAIIETYACMWSKEFGLLLLTFLDHLYNRHLSISPSVFPLLLTSLKRLFLVIFVNPDIQAIYLDPGLHMRPRR